MGEDTSVQLYWAILETWSGQVDSYWQRTSYFAAFETVAIAGTWEVVNEGYRKTGLCLFGFGVILTALWIFNNVKTHQYVVYWWEVLKEIEAYNDWHRRPDYVSRYDQRRERLKLSKTRAKEKWWQKYSNINNVLAPIFFAVVWFVLALIGYFAAKPCHS